jgi:hypothetical protein
MNSMIVGFIGIATLAVGVGQQAAGDFHGRPVDERRREMTRGRSASCRHSKGIAGEVIAFEGAV